MKCATRRIGGISGRAKGLAAVLAGVGAAAAGGSATADIFVINVNDLTSSFVPSTVTVHPGDTVRYMLGFGFHSVRQTASASSCSPLPGGFNSGTCGAVQQFDLVIPANASGTLFFMCECHCIRGMKGQIIVQPACSGAAVTADPAPATGCVGQPTTFSVEASGTGPLLYQWRHGGQDIDGAVGPSYTIDHVSVADAGSYDCVVANACGTDTSAVATLTVCGPDFNCDGFLDFFDYDDFVGAFEGGDPRADYNGDEFADFFDYDAFIEDFERGC